MTTEDDFQKQLDTHPDDFQTKLVFADWLQERGDERAEGMRALGTLRISPEHFDRNTSADRQEAYCWWVPGTDPSHSLPSREWFDALSGSRTPSNSLTNFRNYGTRRECEDAAARAFAQLPAKRRAGLLAPKDTAAKPRARKKAQRKVRKPAARKSKGKGKK